MKNTSRFALIKPQLSREDPAAVLDIGSSKIASMIAVPDANGHPRITGIGQHASNGIRCGEVVDPDALRIAVSKAVESAEAMASAKINKITVGISGGRLKSSMRDYQIETTSGVVTEHEFRRIQRKDFDHTEENDRVALHRLPVQYTLDGGPGIRNPVGMFGKVLSATFCTVTASKTSLDNLAMVVDQAHLKIDRFVANPYAATLSSLTNDEKDLGATIIEIGAGCTGVAFFINGHLRYVDVIPLGGHHITGDIARILSIATDEAERIKTLKGSLLAATGDSDEILTLPMVGDDRAEAPVQIEVGLLGEIIRARIEEIFEKILERLDRAGFATAAGQRVILVGGNAQLPGMREYAATIIGGTVRIGKPSGITGLATATSNSGFAATTGLLHHVFFDRNNELSLTDQRHSRHAGLLARVSDWFRYYIWEAGS